MSVFMRYAKRRYYCICRRVLCNSKPLKTRQIRHAEVWWRATLARCCAIETDHRLKGALQPDGVLDYRRESRIRASHIVLPFDVAQDKMREHRRPYLPFDSVLVLAEERLELERLLEFLKEEINRPSRFVESRDRGRAPLEVVRAESHLAHLLLDLDKGLDATQRLGIVRTCRRARQPYRLVGDDTCRQIISGHALHDSVSGRLLFPDDEEHPAKRLPVQHGKVVVRPVEYSHVARQERGEKLFFPPGIVLARLPDDGELREHVRHVGDHVQLHGGLALPVLRPLDAPVGKLYRRGVYRVYAAQAELRERAFVPRVGKCGILPCELSVNEPEELLHHAGVARPVGVRECRELHGLYAAYTAELPGEYRREVDEFVQGEDMRKLTEHQQVHLRGVGKLPGFDFLSGRECLDFVSWQVALDNLRKNWYHSPCRCFKSFFHGTVYDTRESGSKQRLFYFHQAIAIAW